ncbi:hypothetical protein MSM1_17550 [Mycobacterium sp. SM1]|uniref:hypothetical protein n=1 Tax=Mycobacterium sp. SM1 TaxID=2816243 RepID=UPI001BCB21C9|nr:hypothetical protein [Mycobacterium sp. SM1]MBS4730065.1 hypothetical protein [Mycobacterium sp. SM1]
MMYGSADAGWCPDYGPGKDMVGLPLGGEDMEPVRLVTGKPPEQWTEQEREDWFLWQLGPQFRVGLKPPPGGASYYIPSPNDPYYFNRATGRFEAKPNTSACRVFD